MGETSGAKPRREREQFFEKYCQGTGIDIGAGPDPLFPGMAVADATLGDDATSLSKYSDNLFDFVHSSHCLEHVTFARRALQEWRRIMKPGGRLILILPERDLYERKCELPSVGNGDHKHFWKLFENNPPCTFGIVPLLLSMGGWEVVYARVCDCYNIEVVAIKI